MESHILCGVQSSFAAPSIRSRNGFVGRSNAAVSTEGIPLCLVGEGQRKHLRSLTGLHAAAAASNYGTKSRTSSTSKSGWSSNGNCEEEEQALALTLRRGRGRGRRSRVSAGSKLDDEREGTTGISGSGSGSSKEKEEQKNSNGLVEKIEAELGRQFGGVLWFSVLFISLAFFGGGYAYFVINYADFSDIPIIRGSQR